MFVFSKLVMSNKKCVKLLEIFEKKKVFSDQSKVVTQGTKERNSLNVEFLRGIRTIGRKWRARSSNRDLLLAQDG